MSDDSTSYWPTSQLAREIPVRRAQNKATQALIEARHILQGETPTQIRHDEGAIGYSLKAHCSNCGQFGTVDDHALICVRCGGRHNLTPVESAVRDADQMLWDKQTDEGPSALEKLKQQVVNG